ncbi:hypothetical protein K457DRAFT_1560667 [Linnemannia elongata AG-77]|uniref:Uncharacterized protein n=1 Tax=Linnemannia elongata AG-77 TaxID=1314771 RepID=A0A197KBZ2_9FUNG|nr:hypothetical protein K457DRAFT_1560667 [Linnemannia elongata AG-77]
MDPIHITVWLIEPIEPRCQFIRALYYPIHPPVPASVSPSTPAFLPTLFISLFSFLFLSSFPSFLSFFFFFSIFDPLPPIIPPSPSLLHLTPPVASFIRHPSLAQSPANPLITNSLHIPSFRPTPLFNTPHQLDFIPPAFTSSSLSLSHPTLSSRNNPLFRPTLGPFFVSSHTLYL